MGYVDTRPAVRIADAVDRIAEALERAAAANEERNRILERDIAARRVSWARAEKANAEAIERLVGTDPGGEGE
jgi:hypothetical protein